MKREFRAYRVDANQPELVSLFRKLGWSVALTHASGNGVPDCFISKYGWLTIGIEIKDGLKPSSARELKPNQRLFFLTWQGLRCVVKCRADVLKIDEQARKLPKMDIQITGCADPEYRIGLS